jgi:hypothetical protein
MSASAIAGAAVVSQTILQLLSAAMDLAARQSTGVPITEEDITKALAGEAATHDELVALIAAKKQAAFPVANP